MERSLKVKRLEALEVINELSSQQPVVVTCAATSRELASIDNRPNHFYTLDSMGLVGSIATGLAIAIENSPLTKVVAVEGDGSLLMNPNVLPTGGYIAPKKFLLIVLDNNVHGSTADLPTYATQIDLAAIAEATGWAIGRANDPVNLRQEYERLAGHEGPAFLHVRIEAGNASDIPKLLVDPVAITIRFRSWIQKHLHASTAN